MIATILPSSSTFHAVEYNERKVAKGHAQLLEMSNFGFVGQISPYTPEELKNYLKQYTEDRNRHIKRSSMSPSHAEVMSVPRNNSSE